MPSKETVGSVVSTPEFSISNNQSPSGDAGERAALDAALASFASKPVVQGSVNGSYPGTNSNVTPSAEVLDDEETLTTNPTEVGDDSEATETEDEDTTEKESTGFDTEFESRFGVKPEEALDTVNQLLAFRDEVSLMRSWQVSAGDYDLRMSQVKDFYNTLPEDKQPEFNTAEGAKAIWEHLSKTTGKKNSTAIKSGTSKLKNPSASKPMLKKSEILKMPNDVYKTRIQEINQAYREGRVVEDV